MRDPNRIPGVLHAVQAYWEEHPDLRLGQILAVAAFLWREQPDPFYMEDEDLVTAIGEMRRRDEAGDW